MGERGTFVPRHLDDLPQFLWWEADEMAILFLCFIFGLIAGYLTTAIIIGVVCAYIVGKSKQGKATGYVVHWAYWLGVPNFQLKYSPPGTVRELVE